LRRMASGADGTHVRVHPSDLLGKVARVTRERVRQMLQNGSSISEVARALGVAKSTVCYHARRLGYRPDSRFSTRYDWKAIAAFYDEGHTVDQCMSRFGFSMSAWADAIKRGDVSPRPRATPADELLSGNRPASRGQLKRRLIAEGLKSPRCERCGITEWRGRALTMALHHINGDGLDNRLENLALLCPNCHAQTPNFSGKNRRLRRIGAALIRAGARPLDRPAMRALPMLGEVA
jgi:Helix-turn-helix domain of resolvase/HNH endonuclease